QADAPAEHPEAPGAPSPPGQARDPPGPEVAGGAGTGHTFAAHLELEDDRRPPGGGLTAGREPRYRRFRRTARSPRRSPPPTESLVQRLLGELEVTGARISVASTRRRRSRPDGRRRRDPAGFDRPDLDAPAEVLVQPRRRVFRRHLDRLVEIARLDQEVAAELFLGLRVRTVGDGDSAAAGAQAHGVLGGRERADLQELTGALQVVVER